MGTAVTAAMDSPRTGRASRDAPPRGGRVKADRRAGARAEAKAAELASALGAIVLGAGLALVLPVGLRAYALPLLVVGVLVHGAGMTLKYRLDGRDGPPLWWERALFWLCWACLAALGLWLAVAFASAR
jgi:hypothetical protein